MLTSYRQARADAYRAEALAKIAAATAEARETRRTPASKRSSTEG